MRKNITHLVEVITTRNELADAIDSKKAIIDIQGEAYDSLIEEVKKELRKNRAEKSVNAVIVGTSLLSMALSGIGILALINLVAAGTLDYKRRKNNISQYSLYVFYVDTKEKLFLVNRDEYNPVYDVVSGYESFIFTDMKKCPVCGKKIKKEELQAASNSFWCGNCKRTVICASSKSLKAAK